MRVLTAMLYMILVMCVIQAWRLTYDSDDALAVLVLTAETAATAFLGATLVASFF